MFANPAIASGWITDSAPPQIAASQNPRWMYMNASPIACAPVEHAVHVALFGPLAPVRIETTPAGMLTMLPGMKNADTRRGPFATRSA
jgi:hypothetical protein